MKTNGHGPNGHTGNGHANGHGSFFEAPDFDDEPDPVNQSQPWTFTGEIPTLSWWLGRELQPRDNLLGEFISTTSRILLVGPTGLGKTNFLLAVALSLATGLNFLHWRAVRPARVLYIDGEMPSRLIKRRLADTVRRHRAQSDNFVLLSREDYPDMPPLNTEKGQHFVDDFMLWAGGFDVVIFDNIQALLAGEMKDAEQWAKMLNWVRDLTRRNIGQIWVHHTGHDEARSYGDKTREWQMDTVALLEGIEDPADIAFNLKFTKARERTPDNRNDFEDATITLADDQWTSSRSGGGKPGRPGQVEDLALLALAQALTNDPQTPHNHANIPRGTICVHRDLWFRYFERSYVGSTEPKNVSNRFGEIAKKLHLAGRIGFSKPWVWPVS